MMYILSSVTILSLHQRSNFLPLAGENTSLYQTVILLTEMPIKATLFFMLDGFLPSVLQLCTVNKKENKRILSLL